MRHQHYRTIGAGYRGGAIALDREYLRSQIPAAFADGAHSRTSSRYSFLPTSSILDGMASEGWEPVAAQEQLVRDETRKGFQKHMIRFAHRNDLGKMVGERAEIVVVNSHDRSSAYQIHAGVFRFVCCNGLVLCDESFSRVSITHMGFSPDKVVEASVRLAGNIPALMDAIQEMKTINLTQGERGIFAEAATIARFGSVEDAPIRPEKLLLPRRSVDGGADIWTTYNTVQENAVQGGQRDFAKRRPDNTRMPKTRAVKGLDSNIGLNKALHHLATRMVELKKAA